MPAFWLNRVRESLSAGRTCPDLFAGRPDSPLPSPALWPPAAAASTPGAGGHAKLPAPAEADTPQGPTACGGDDDGTDVAGAGSGVAGAGGGGCAACADCRSPDDPPPSPASCGRHSQGPAAPTRQAAAAGVARLSVGEGVAAEGGGGWSAGGCPAWEGEFVRVGAQGWQRMRSQVFRR